MSDAKFTKGEWVVNKYTSTVNGISRVFAYEVWSGNQRIVNKTEINYPCEEIKTELLANARLIAAAPSMYEMLKEARKLCHSGGYFDTRDKIDSVLAKALGE